MKPFPTLTEKIDQAVGRRTLDAMDAIEAAGAKGADADKILLKAQVDGLEDIARLVIAEVEKIRASL